MPEYAPWSEPPSQMEGLFQEMVAAHYSATAGMKELFGPHWSEAMCLDWSRTKFEANLGDMVGKRVNEGLRVVFIERSLELLKAMADSNDPRCYGHRSPWDEVWV